MEQKKTQNKKETKQQKEPHKTKNRKAMRYKNGYVRNKYIKRNDREGLNIHLKSKRKATAK